MRESFSLTRHFIVKIHTYHQGNMFQLQGAIIRPLYKNRSLSGFGVRLGSQLFKLLRHCCIQCANLVKNEVKMEDSVMLKYTIKLELTIK